MSTEAVPRVIEQTPQDAWTTLQNDKASVLVDVRTQAEWAFVGLPDLSSLGKTVLQIEWKRYPGMDENTEFLGSLARELDGSAPSRLLFLCRSGVRSLGAAQAVAQSYARSGQTVTCVNVVEGFEGDLDAEKHRGTLSGWKARGLPWRQS